MVQLDRRTSRTARGARQQRRIQMRCSTCRGMTAENPQVSTRTDDVPGAIRRGIFRVATGLACTFYCVAPPTEPSRVMRRGPRQHAWRPSRPVEHRHMRDRSARVGALRRRRAAPRDGERKTQKRETTKGLHAARRRSHAASVACHGSAGGVLGHAAASCRRDRPPVKGPGSRGGKRRLRHSHGISGRDRVSCRTRPAACACATALRDRGAQSRRESP